jgi:hypothetical protein
MRHALFLIPIALACTSDKIGAGYGAGQSTNMAGANGATPVGGATSTSSAAMTTGGIADGGNAASCPEAQPATGELCSAVSPCVYETLSCSCIAGTFMCSIIEDDGNGGSGGNGGDDEPFGSTGNGGNPFGGNANDDDDPSEGGAAGAERQ